MSLNSKILHLREVITVEPLIGIFTMLSSSHHLISYHFEDHFKDKDDLYSLRESVFIQLVNLVILIPTILALFFGSCSDKFKTRKPFLLLPIFGELVFLIGYATCALFKNHCPGLLTVFFRCIPSCFGGNIVFYMAAFAYIADVSNPQQLNFRVGVLYIVENLSLLLNRYNLFSYEDHWTVILVALGLSVFAIFYGIFWVKEPAQFFNTAQFIRNTFSWRHAWKTLSVPFRIYEGKKMLLFLILCTIIFMYRMVNYGLNCNLIFLAHIRSPFMRDYDIFAIIFTIGTLIVILLFTQVFKVDDTMLLILSFICQILSNILIAVGDYKGLLYLGSLIGIFTVFSSFIAVSMVLKTSSANNFGKISAIIAIFDSAGFLPVQTIVANTNIENLVYFVYVGAILFFILLPVVGWIHIDAKRNRVGESLANNLPERNQEDTTI